MRAARCQRPKQVHVPGRGIVSPWPFGGFGGEGRRGDLLPVGALVAALAKLHAKMPHAQGSVPAAVTRVGQHLGDGLTLEVMRHDGPVRTQAFDHKQTLAGGNHQGEHH